ncbi:MAG TPA: universal stress protein [Solirubrobacteraceae bacterium]|nr:universal stress protein [Solirubrobacteraceae bacterium]
MFRKVVVGVDGGTGGRDAITLARQLVTRDGELILANVQRSPGAEQSLDLLEKQRTSAQVDAQLKTLRNRSVGRGLHEYAEAEQADLLVVGSSHRGRVGRVFLGDDTRATLNGAPCPVALASAGYVRSRHRLREIGVGYDRSAESELALALGRRLAADAGAKLSLLEVLSLRTQDYLGGVYDLDDAIDRLVDDALTRLGALRGVEPHAVYGVPSRELARYSDSVDLLILGSRDLGRTGRLILGSTAQTLARTSGCPLLVVGRSARTSTLGLDETVLQGVPD